MRNKSILFIISVLILALLVSCRNSIIDEPQYEDPDEQALPVAMQPDTLRLLAIGNSFTIDALTFLPYILQRISPQSYVVVGILYTGGAAMSYHLVSFTNNTAYQTYFKWTPEMGIWYKESITLPLFALADERWDYVTLQQVSAHSNDYVTILPYLQPLVDILLNNGYTGHLGWLLTPAYPDGSPRLTNGTMKVDGASVTYTSDEMFAAIAACTQQVMNSGCCDFVLPCGTALQNARHTSLRQYGAWGQLTSDGMHLQSGIPMYVESCAAAMVLLNTAFDKCHLDIQLGQYQIMSRGTQVGMSNDNQDLAVTCAAQAFLNPFTLKVDSSH